jgi:hypothetical protein
LRKIVKVDSYVVKEMPAMRHRIKLVAVFFLLFAVAELSIANSAFARGGGANLMNSPGYQRALEESRKRYRQEAQPYTQPAPVYPRKKWRHRGRR